MPPETMDYTQRNLELELANSGAAPASAPPKTPQDFVLQAQTYLMAMNPSTDDPRHEFQNEILQGLNLAREQLSQKEAPRVTVASKIVRPERRREDTSRKLEAAPYSPPRRTRYEPPSYKETNGAPERRAQRSGYEDDPNDMRNRIAHRKQIGRAHV